MEPILKHPSFASLLKVWRFVTVYYQFLELPQKMNQLSLYQLDDLIKVEQKSKFVESLIDSLTRKADQLEKGKWNKTIFSMALSSKFKIFDDLLKTSSYELALSQVNFSYDWMNIPTISIDLPFEKLQLAEKYYFLSGLVQLVENNKSFKIDYMQKIKDEHEKQISVQGANTSVLNHKYSTKTHPFQFLGADSNQNSFIYISTISDSILSFNKKTNIWRQIKGQDDIVKEILAPLEERSQSLTNQEFDLMESICVIWNKISDNWKIFAFQTGGVGLFKDNEPLKQINKLELLKEKFHQLDIQYSRFISDCYNFRWADKKRRNQLHNSIDEAKEIADLVSCFGEFFSQTKNGMSKKIDTLDFYDYDLKTPDVDPAQFRHFFLRMNYLYSKPAFIEPENSKDYPGIYSFVKSFLSSPQSQNHFAYEYLMIFVLSMIHIVQNLYPSHYQRRLKFIQKQTSKIEQKERMKKIQAQAQKKRNNSKLQKVSNRVQLDLSSEEDNNSQTTIQKRHMTSENNIKGGKRLRQKVKINYKVIQNSSSNANSKKLKPKQATKFQPSRQAKSKKSKMRMDSDTEEQSSYDSDAKPHDQSTQEKQKGALNLDDYHFEKNEEETVNLRRSHRNSSGRR